MRHSAAVLYLTTIVLIVPRPAGAQELSRTVLDRLKASTVFVVTETGTGTGFVVARSEGSAYLLTCWHVIADTTRIRVVFNSGRPGEIILPAEVLGASPEMDLAGLRVANPPPGAEPLALAQKTDVRETETVFAAGFPFGGRLAADVKNPEIAVTRASVASLRTDNAGNLVAVQFAGELHPGNSGGPVVDSGGRVIGVA